MFAAITNLMTYFAAACQPKGIKIIPTWYQYLEGRTENGKCVVNVDAFKFPDDVDRILLAGVDILLRGGAIIAVGFVIYGGYKYIASQGEPDKTNEARHMITNALIGLVIASLATVIVNLVAGQLT